MATLNEYVKGKEFGSDTTPLPEGETVLDTTKIQVKETVAEFDGKERKRFELSDGSTVYGVGVKVMDGIKKAVAGGATRVKIIRQGTDKKTSYVVLPVEE